MLTQVVVVLDQITHYLVEYPQNARDVRKLVVASGVCNDIPFAATARNDPDFSTHLDLFRRDGRQFSKMEFQSIQRRIKMATPLQIVDWRGDPEAKGYRHFYDQMCEDYYGKKIYLLVPFNRKDQAKGLGAQWDAVAKKWFCHADCTDLRQLEKCFKRDVVL